MKRRLIVIGAILLVLAAVGGWLIFRPMDVRISTCDKSLVTNYGAEAVDELEISDPEQIGRVLEQLEAASFWPSLNDISEGPNGLRTIFQLEDEGEWVMTLYLVESTGTVGLNQETSTYGLYAVDSGRQLIAAEPEELCAVLLELVS